jgi:D-glycero-alpha-D-manno-heptose 1-phosphate guanylyltransferase
MRMLVLAGGFGTRLQSAVSLAPKALAPVGDIPFLQFQLEHWVRQGIKSFVFLLHHQANLIKDFLDGHASGILRDCQYDWLIEAEPLGTGGAVANAVTQLQIQGDFLVTNADTWLGSGVADLMRSQAPALSVIRVDDAGRYGSVQFDQSYKVTTFLEKSVDVQAGWINAGMALLNSKLFEQLKPGVWSLENSLFPSCANLGILHAVPIQCDFIDIGIPTDYQRFCRWITAERKGVL